MAMQFEGQFTADDIQRASELFDQMALERHMQGAEEYGATKFLTNDVMIMLAEELLDAANYIRYQFIKIVLLNELLQQELQKVEQNDGQFHAFSEGEMK